MEVIRKLGEEKMKSFFGGFKLKRKLVFGVCCRVLWIICEMGKDIFTKFVAKGDDEVGGLIGAQQLGR